MDTAEHVAPKTKPACSKFQIPRPAAVLKESTCTCFAAECIWDVPVYFWQDLLPGSVSASWNWDEILQHSKSVFYIFLRKKPNPGVGGLCTSLLQVAKILFKDYIRGFNWFQSSHWVLHVSHAFCLWVQCFLVTQTSSGPAEVQHKKGWVLHVLSTGL